MTLNISLLTKPDIESAYKLIEITERDAFQSEQLTQKKHQEMIARDLLVQKIRLKRGAKNTPNNFFLVAKENTKLIGVFGCLSQKGNATKKTFEYLKKPIPPKLVELVSLYVLPQYQGKGIGNQLVDQMQYEMQQRKINAFLVYSGYKSGIAFWGKRLGRQTTILKSFFEGEDCYVWVNLYPTTSPLKTSVLKKAKLVAFSPTKTQPPVRY